MDEPERRHNFERRALRAQELTRIVQEACAAERAALKELIAWAEQKKKQDEKWDATKDKLRASVFGQIIIWLFIGMGAAVWSAFQVLVKRTANGD